MSAKKFSLTFEIESEDEARELREAWHEIVTGKKLRDAATHENGVAAIRVRGRAALQTLETAVHEHPTAAQARRVVRFLAGIYNGSDYPFDLTHLRALDRELANACLEYLNYDRLGKRKVQLHLSGGERALQGWLRDYGIEPALRLSQPAAEAFSELSETRGRSRCELLDEAVTDLVDKYRRSASASKP